MVFGSLISSLPDVNAFLTSGQLSFSRVLNPDWSIKISTRQRYARYRPVWFLTSFKLSFNLLS